MSLDHAQRVTSGSGLAPQRRHSWRDDPAVPAFPDDAPLVVFDGVCVLCAASVRFILARDRTGTIRFCPVQSPLGTAITRHVGLDPEQPETVLLLADGQVFRRSAAAIEAMRRCGGVWRLARALYVIPRPLRDALYGAVARRRYRLFGRRDSCLMPTPELRRRFLA